jgi:regulator of protease activity HflC (stomatin/prohibitin superfamily)
MTALSELLQALLGWLADLTKWVVGWCPRYFWVRSNQAGVLARGGGPWSAVGPGFHWYVPNRDTFSRIVTSMQTLEVAPVALQTPEGFAVKVGAVVTYRVTDPVKHLVENWDTDGAIAEFVRGCLTEVVTTEPWVKLMSPRKGGTWLGVRLQERVGRDLERYGVEVEVVRPTDQVKLRGAFQVFGIEPAGAADPVGVS